ncbi:MAG TPA: CheR family methyltransferase, partial [Prolixibacteraceae bacterium]
KIDDRRKYNPVASLSDSIPSLQRSSASERSPRLARKRIFDEIAVISSIPLTILGSNSGSTGEEAYSLAIALHRIIPDIKDWQITVLGTDMNEKALIKAVSGIYSRWSFRNCPAWLKANYFHHLGNGNYEVLPKIRTMATFSNLNLTEDIFTSLTNNIYAFDIIFCRNVLMYFTDEWIGKITQNLFQALNPKGWFVVSSCELNSQRFPQFRTVNFPGAVLYQKNQQGIFVFSNDSAV